VGRRGRAAAELAELGVTTLEVLPVHAFPGRFGWGYDGVLWYAPSAQYGTPDDMRRFVDRAHALGMAVVLDVVYNHLGPDGNYAGSSRPLVQPEHTTDWGDAINYDGAHSRAGARVRRGQRAATGWRSSASTGCGSTPRTPSSTRRRCTCSPSWARRCARPPRGSAGARRGSSTRTSRSAPRSSPRREGGCDLDAIWNDDWHHSAYVGLTLRDEAWFTDYRGHAREFVAGAKYGFLYQGQWYRWQGRRRGTPAFGVAPWRFVHFLENHDQVANGGVGERLHQMAAPGALRALTAALLLGPQTPMLFQGQEWAASAPFQYFADHAPELAPLVQRGRFAELAQFPSLASDAMQAVLPVPHAESTFRGCVLDWGERERGWHAAMWRLHRDLIALRRGDAVFSVPRAGVGAGPGTFDGAALADRAFVLRFFGEGGDDRLLVVNYGPTVHLDVAPEPLLAPPAGARWHTLWSSEAPEYGGLGSAPYDAPDAGPGEAPRPPHGARPAPGGRPAVRWPRENWRVLGGCAAVLAPRALPPAGDPDGPTR
jgi:maltooligosyltrehalose trehalohydrolase